jgi:hypothetical protein
MNKTIQTFLDRATLAPQDLIAKRAIRAIDGLQGLITNAYNRGDAEGMFECRRGLAGAVSALACVNTEQHYDFAAQVHPDIPAATEFFAALDIPAGEAEGLLADAEEIFDSLKDELTPVCTVHGVTSSAILRGFHCDRALAGVAPVNDN